MDALYSELKKFGKVKLNEPLSKHTTFKIGGPARFFVTVDEKKKLVDLLNFVNANGVDFFIIGGGSNLLFSDEEYDGVMIKIATKTAPEYVASGLGYNITAEAGVLLGAVVNLAAKSGLSGMEWAIGIPGTIGGAVRGNAGAMGKDASYTVKEVEVWHNGEITNLKASDCEFGYRESMFKYNKGVILSVKFLLEKGNKTAILALMQKYLKQRTPRMSTYPSAGSFFKNIKIKKWPGDVSDLPELFVQRGSVPAGWVVEQLNLKGFTIGGAKISDEHGNFIINFNQATQKNVVDLVEEIKEKVYNKYKVELEPEVQIFN